MIFWRRIFLIEKIENIRIHIKMNRIRNTSIYNSSLMVFLKVYLKVCLMAYLMGVSDGLTIVCPLSFLLVCLYDFLSLVRSKGSRKKCFFP